MKDNSRRNMVVMAALALVFVSGCSHVRLSPNRGASVNGFTLDTISAMAVAGDHNLERKQQEECWKAYHRGDVFACPGSYGGYYHHYGHGDYSLYYNGLLPQQQPALPIAPETQAVPPEEGAVDQKAREMAEDAIRMNKRIVRELQKEGTER